VLYVTQYIQVAGSTCNLDMPMLAFCPSHLLV
jgi:hypothetical protein